MSGGSRSPEDGCRRGPHLRIRHGNIATGLAALLGPAARRGDLSDCRRVSAWFGAGTRLGLVDAPRLRGRTPAAVRRRRRRHRCPVMDARVSGGVRGPGEGGRRGPGEGGRRGPHPRIRHCIIVTDLVALIGPAARRGRISDCRRVSAW